jgi:hypothetical protein
MPEKNQVFMFSDGELQLIKSVFADNDELIYAIRNVMLQFEVTKEQKEMIRAQVTPEVAKILEKKLLPFVDGTAPLTQLADLRQTLTNDLRVKTVEEMEPLFKAKQLEIEYLEQQFNLVKYHDATLVIGIRLARLAELHGKTPEQLFIDTTARNFILGFVDPMLRDFKVLAGTKGESLEKQKERLSRESNK